MKRKSLIIGIALLGAFVCVSLHGFGLEKKQNRKMSTGHLSKQLKERIKEECKNADPEKCSLYGMKLTCELLRFTSKNDIENGKANCVGYAQLCSEICNYALKQNDISNRTRPVVGYVTFYGINLCSILESIAPKEYKNFVKDHDFVELDLDNNSFKYFDASLYDYYIDCTSYSE
jgi:hypothetical protein